MDNFLMMYRGTPHSTSGVSPAELLFRRRVRTKLSHLSKSSASKMRFEIATVREKQRERFMQNAKGMQVKVRLEKVRRCY